MKHFLSIIVITLLMATSANAADVGVSVSVGQPGFYGHLDIGNFPHPDLIYHEPTVVRPHVGIVEQPVYMHVPPGHAKKWSKHCHKYNACGRPVYFVRDRWYNDVYVPHHRGQGKRHGDVNAPRHQPGGEQHGNAYMPTHREVRSEHYGDGKGERYGRNGNQKGYEGHGR